VVGILKVRRDSPITEPEGHPKWSQFVYSGFPVGAVRIGVLVGVPVAAF
jgi:hypothetical protein